MHICHFLYLISSPGSRVSILTFLGACCFVHCSGLFGDLCCLQFPAITSATVAATANNRIFAQEYRISNIVGVAFKEVGGIQNNAVRFELYFCFTFFCFTFFCFTFLCVFVGVLLFLNTSSQRSFACTLVFVIR